MTRKYVYGIGLVAFIAATAMTIAAIFIPEWVTWTSTTADGTYQKSIGLHESCSSTKGCSHFPQYEDCHGTDRYFCSMWRSVGFLVSFAAVLELTTIVAFVVLLNGDKHQRVTGWKVLCFMLVLVGVVQCAGMSIVAYLFDNDDRFFVGWKLDKSFILVTVSWCIAIVSAACISMSAFIFPEEGGYELIPSERHY